MPNEVARTGKRESLAAEYQSFQSKADALWVGQGCREAECVSDGQQVKIPAPLVIRTAGTREGSRAERKAWCKESQGLENPPA